MTLYPTTIAPFLASVLGLGLIAMGSVARQRALNAKRPARWLQPVGFTVLLASGAAEGVIGGVAGFAIWTAALGPIGWGVANVMSRGLAETRP